MKNSFTSATFYIDLSHVQLMVQEENPIFKNGFFTKFTFPFEFAITPELRGALGDISNPNATGLARSFTGYFAFEGRLHKAELTFVSVQENIVTAQIDYGFEELPDLQKQLSEIVSGFAHIEGNTVDYAFPELVFEDYKGADYFDSFLNRINARTQTGAFVENDYSYSGNNPQAPESIAIMKNRNRNIVQPMLSVLFVFEKIAESMGLELLGNGLHHLLHMDQVIYKPLKRYTFNDQPEYTFEIDSNGEEYQTFEVRLTPGEYYIPNQSIAFSDVSIRHKESEYGLSYYEQNGMSVAFFKVLTYHQDETFIVRVKKHVRSYTLDIKPYKGDYFSNGNPVVPYPLLSDIRRWDMRCLVPEMTVGDFLNIFKTLFLFDIEIKDKYLVLNYTESTNHINRKNPHDIRHCEVKNPVLNYPEKKVIHYVFPPVSGYEFPSIYMDNQVMKIGNAPDDENKTELNFYALPYASNNLQNAVCKASDVLIFANKNHHYFGFRSQYDNRFQEKFHPSDLAKKMYKTMFSSLKNRHIQWTFIDKRSFWRDIKVSDMIFAYNRTLLIKEMTKTILNDDLCQIELSCVIVN